jgi:hypothetical protein
MPYLVAAACWIEVGGAIASVLPDTPAKEGS